MSTVQGFGFLGGSLGVEMSGVLLGVKIYGITRALDIICLKSLTLNNGSGYERDRMLSLPTKPKVKPQSFCFGLKGAHPSRDVYHNKRSVLPPFTAKADYSLAQSSWHALPQQSYSIREARWPLHHRFRVSRDFQWVCCRWSTPRLIFASSNPSACMTYSLEEYRDTVCNPTRWLDSRIL